jgi:adenine-specific DNA-methyltransferase
MAKKKIVSTKVSSIRHQDKRKNIPTEELRDFVAEDEAKPKTMLYPRDPSLDPQLVWKGKDEQDRADLAVPVVPVYIQEKIHPQAIIDAMPRLEQPGDNQPSLFADFNGGPANFEQKVEFYQHDQNWTNRMILGDSLLVMTSLAEKEGLKGKVQTIYIDPPYGIKFGSNWQVSTRKRDVQDGKAEDAVRQPEQIKAFRDTWERGIHSYLAYLRDRLMVARDLLTETGSVFVQISDVNVHLVRTLLDEIFGSENQCATIVWKKGTPDSSTIRNAFNYLLWYMKDTSLGASKVRKLFLQRAGDEGSTEDPRKLALWGIFPDGERPLSTDEKRSIILTAEKAKVFRVDKIIEAGNDPERQGSIKYNGKEYFPGAGKVWRGKTDQMDRLHTANRIIKTDEGFGYRFFIDDFPIIEITNLWEDTAGNIKDMRYVVETNPKIVERCLLMTTDPGDLVLDITCGSGTSAYVSEQWGRRWITCDTSRVALALARTRLMAAKYPYYLLADSQEGIRKEAELTGKIPADYKTEGDIRKGFVYKRVPHVTLKSIANNPDIKEGMTREQIDAAIARHTDSETLYDQPYEDNKRVRVCGPFSVESLSPHRVLSTADEDLDGTVSEKEARKNQDFNAMILENLKKAGVQNTRRKERLTFNHLETYAGTWLQAVGEFTEADGKNKRAAISIGPEHGTVGPMQVKEAAKEAVQGLGFDMLIVLGFAFDPHVDEEVKRYGKLTVLPAKMNPDLAMGDELLKKTGAGNLFMVFGEPDIEIKKQKDGQVIVEIKGVDVYDPTTGQIRSASTDDIACWFIDTNYNGESFFVRHAYFTGAEEPYDKLKRALRAEIDEAAWASLYSTTSRPFPIPETGKIAIKVINHYGDEVLKVFELKNIK